ncbi:MAG: SusC/RagA family TonB-linked outer membrane protein [Bacteroidota bacterium]|nr:SusC/RagA family TonB-linked outer membrane protein [Bacteroidota bacterium]
MRKLLAMLAAVLLFAGQLLAQKTITGKVTDDKGNPLPNASVIVKGTSTGTVTKSDGTYSLTVPAKARALVFSSVDMAPLEVVIGSETTISPSLKPVESVLAEVVMVGYGTQKRKEVTGNLSNVTGKAVAEKPVQSFEQAIAGRATGVQITVPNGVLNNPPVFRIRGTNSISLSSYPLIVVDGVPTFTGDVGSSNAAANALASINPNDIESIDIAKDAAASAIYGSRAANGVVFITTKKGKAGKAKVNYDGWVGFSQVYGFPDLLNAQQYVDIKNEGLKNAGTYNAATNYFALTTGPDGNPIDTKWKDVVYRKGVSSSNFVNVSGGNDATNYYFSVGYTSQQGIIRKNDFKRKSALFNIDSKPNKVINLGAKISYSGEDNLAAVTSGSLPGEGFNTAGLGRLAFVTAPDVSPYNSDGSYNINANNAIGVMSNKVAAVGFYNPQLILDLNRSNSFINHIQSNAYVQIKPVRWVTLKSAYGIDYLDIDNEIFQTGLHGDGFSVNGNASSNFNKLKRWVWDNTAQFDYVFAQKHTVSLLFGEEEQRTTQIGYGLNRQTLSDPFYTNIQGGFTTNNATGLANTENYLLSYFGRLNYNYAGKYFLTGVLRQDQYSAFGANNKKGNFWSASGSWDVSKETFWHLDRVINSLKIRGSYGTVGNSTLGNFDAFSFYGSGLYGGSPTFSFSQAGNSNLKWETSSKTDIGLSAGLFNDKITIDAAYYRNDYKDLILAVPYAPSSGLPNSIVQNIASLYNKGFEFSINADPVKRKDFTWNSSLNISTNQNKITKLASEAGINQITNTTSSLETTSITKVGYAIGTIFVTRTAGVDPATGRRIFINAAGRNVLFQLVPPAGQFQYMYEDGTKAPNVSLADAVPYKNTNPKLYGGWDNNFRYKDFELGMLWTFQAGFYVYYGSGAGLRDQRFWNNSTDVLRRWQKPGDVTDVPRIVNGDNVSNGSSFPLDINVYKGDFLKLKSLTLSYNLPKFILDKAHISSARIYVSGQNLAIITKYPGPDPEVSSNGTANNTQGVDRNGVANARVLTVGLNIGF